MIKVPEDIIREFPIQWRTDRDVENPLVIEFLQKIAPIESLLDCGAHSSTGDDKYGKQIRPFIKHYAGIDIMDDLEARKVLDAYYIGNINQFWQDSNLYDVVICVSSIEHSGVSTYKGNPIEERMKLFKRCLELARKYLWISFPTGLEYTYPNELSIITETTLKTWEDIVRNKGYKLKERFFHNQGGPQLGTPWIEHNNRKAATLQQYWDYCGNQSLCVLEIEK